MSNINEYRIIINKYNDFKEGFVKEYLDKEQSEEEYDLKESFRNTKSKFVFEIDIKDIENQEERLSDLRKILNYYRNSKKKYEKRYQEIQFFLEVHFRINNNKDYIAFYDEFVEKENDGILIKKNKIQLKEEYGKNNVKIFFVMPIPPGEKPDEMFLHNFIVIVNKCANMEWALDIVQEEAEEGNQARLQMYLKNVLEKNIKIKYNGKSLTKNENTARKLLPAIWVDKELLECLQKPITEKLWNDIFLNKNSNGVTLNSLEMEYRNLLMTCRKYLFGELYDHQSKVYSECREEIFKSKAVEKEILNMPFLALLIFAQYDYFYRTFLGKKYKDTIAKKGGKDSNRLRIEDLKISLQKNQEPQRYQAFQDLKSEGYNVKNLFSGENDNEVHSEVIAELFEARTIAEGLLQVIENAVIHAGGGLLSMIIYRYNSGEDKDKKNDDNVYLDKAYPKYFNELRKENKNVEFFLEIKVSDISVLNMKEKFEENVEERINNLSNENEKKILTEWLEKFRSESKGNFYNSFFLPEGNLWTEYYQMGNNRVFHYGLQIFDSIVNAKKGNLVVSGHGYVYPEADKDESTDKDISGTHYQILLPLRYNYLESESGANSELYFWDRMSLKEMEEYTINTNGNTNINCVNVFESFKNYSIPDKNNRIMNLQNKIIKKLEKKTGKFILLLDCSEIKDLQSSYTMEVVIKALLGALLNQKEMPPIIIINLSSYQLLECVRIIALFYDRRGKNDDFAKLQVFLRGEKVGDEIILCGNDMNKMAYNLKKTALTNGLISDYWSIADRLLRREK